MISTHINSSIQNTISSRYKIAQLFLISGNSLFLLPFFILILSTAYFLIGQPINSSIFIISFLMTSLFIFIQINLLGYGKSQKYFLLTLLLFVFSILASCVVASIIFDKSVDGQWYHQYAVYNLAKGWNPVREQVDNIYANHYSKGAWIYAASLYKVFNSIEVGKAFNIVFILGSFLISLAALLSVDRLKISYALLISFIAAFNPVSLYQSLSFYVDGQLSSLLVALTSLLFLLASNKYIEKGAYLVSLLVPIFVILINVKFSALVYSVVILILFSSYFFVFSRKLFSKFLISGLVAFTVGIVIVGYNPYITNTLYYGHPFYPLAGHGSQDIMGTNTPDSLLNKNRFKKLFLSTFSASSSGKQKSNGYVDLKFPFIIKREEAGTFTTTDTRLAGFGPLFSGLVVLVLGTIVVSLKSKNPHRSTLIVGNIILFATVLVNPECWWARYVPQLWLLPILFMIYAQFCQGKIVKCLGNILIISALLNIGFVSIFYVTSNLIATIEMNGFLSKLSRLNREIILSQSEFISPQLRLSEHHIKYKLVDKKNLPCNDSNYFPLTGEKNRFCLAVDPSSRPTPQ
jgi:hypothetical protein